MSIESQYYLIIAQKLDFRMLAIISLKINFYIMILPRQSSIEKPYGVRRLLKSQQRVELDLGESRNVWTQGLQIEYKCLDLLLQIQLKTFRRGKSTPGMEPEKPVEPRIIPEGDQKNKLGERVSLGLVPSKPTLVGIEYHQIDVPPFSDGLSEIPRPHNFLGKLGTLLRPRPIFLASKTSPSQIEEYLTFAENYFQEKIPQYFAQSKLFYNVREIENGFISGSIWLETDYALPQQMVHFIHCSSSRERMEARALQFLHETNYNFTKAKFLIFFPYYRVYNKYRSNSPLDISNEEMEKKIHDHIESLKNTKEKDLLKWIGTVENSIESRVNLTKLNTMIDIAKQNKFQIPDTIKDQIDRAVKTGKQAKKTIQGGARITIEKLIVKRQLLKENKIVTNDMIQFEQTVNRCEQWIKKQTAFQEQYFDITETQQMEEENSTNQNKTVPKIKATLKQMQQKIQFRTVQNLYNEFNSLPLVHKYFNETTKAFYTSTVNLLQRLPPFIKAPNTRKNNPVKYSYDSIHQLLEETRKHNVYHQDFQNFEAVVNQAMQLMEKVSMFLQDERVQKSVKVLNNYLKLVNEGPIQSNVQQKLQSKLQYYELMEKIKKDIMNPQKFEQIKQSIKKLREKGYECIEHANYEAKLMTIMGWSQSHQILSEERQPHSLIALIKNPKEVKKKMINAQLFKSQLESAQNQLNIPQDISQDYSRKLKLVEQKSAKISHWLQENSPNLGMMIEELNQCIKMGLIFKEFDLLYEEIIKHADTIAKIHYVVDLSTKMLTDDQAPFFTKKESEEILNLSPQNRQALKHLKTRKGVQQIMNAITESPFPKQILQYKLFLQEIGKDNENRKQVTELIDRFTQDDQQVSLKQIAEQYKNCFSCAQLQQEISKIEVVVKWTQKINRKLGQIKEAIFDEEDRNFVANLTDDLALFESEHRSKDQMKFVALQYFQTKSVQIKRILKTITEANVNFTYKISELNKFCKEIDRQFEKYSLNQNKITKLKEKLQREISLSQDWKEKYNSIKRFEQKKLKQLTQERASLISRQKSERDIEEFKSQSLKPHQSFVFQNQQLQADNYNPNLRVAQRSEDEGQVVSLKAIPEEINENQQDNKNNWGSVSELRSRINLVVKNPQFYWYFKFAIIIVEFYHGYNLKFSLDDVVKLKGILTDIHKYIAHYDTVFKKEYPTDVELTNLDSQGNRIPIFFRELEVTKRKVCYLESWKTLANSILKSVPIISMELKARKPEELLDIINNIQQQQRHHQQNTKENGEEQKKPDQTRSKRKIKQNPLYKNEDMTLITEQTFGNKSKKRRKGVANNDSEYRNTAVTSMVKQQQAKKKNQVDDIIYTGQIQADMLVVEDPKQYCICRYGVLNENSVMIQCQSKCDEWFHIECVGMKKNQTKNQKQYTCIGCRTLYQINIEDYQGVFFWDNHRKISRQDLNTLIKEGYQLQVATNQLKKLEIIHQKVKKWEEAALHLLETIIHKEGEEDLTVYEPQLYQLYLHSIWLPTIHHQTEILKKLLLMARGDDTII